MITAILSALPEEQAGLSALLSNKETIHHAGRSFLRGTIHQQLAILALSGIGKVAAATTATALIERFGATHIIFTGVAGGLGEGVQVGDLVIGTRYVQHDMDVSPLFPRFVVPSLGKAILDADTTLIAMFLIAACALSKRAAGQKHQLKSFQIHQGLIASGDRFVSSAAEVRALRASLPEALCVEMEGAAVAQVCHDYGIPFAAVRTISDRADDTAHTDFNAFVKEVAGPVASGLITAFFALQLD